MSGVDTIARDRPLSAPMGGRRHVWQRGPVHVEGRRDPRLRRRRHTPLFSNRSTVVARSRSSHPPTFARHVIGLHRLMPRLKPVIASAVLAAVLASPAAGLDTAHAYLSPVRGYAVGERAEALAELARMPEDNQRRAFEDIHRLGLAAERCPACPAAAEFQSLPLRAAVMLHVDRDDADRPRSEEAEQPRPCPGGQARLAGRHATLMARAPATREFARRFFLAMALRCQWDACLDEAQGWGEEGSKLFPRDGHLLLGLGSIHEEAAALLTTLADSAMARRGAGTRHGIRAAAGVHGEHLKQLRRFFEKAAAADAGLVLARVRLGRVLWRLGDTDRARSELESVIPLTEDSRTLYLAHLFLGRLYEDAGRLDRAELEYREALKLDRETQAAAVALSHVVRLGGDTENSRHVLADALFHAGERKQADTFWGHLTSHVVAPPDVLFHELRLESLK